MSSSDRTDPAASKGPATYVVDAVVAVIVFFIGAVVIFGSRKLVRATLTRALLARCSSRKCAIQQIFSQPSRRQSHVL